MPHSISTKFAIRPTIDASMGIRRLCPLVLLLLPLIPGGALDFWDEAPPEELAARLVAAMDDQEILGQSLVLGYQGSTPTQRTLSLVSHRKIGGIKIFGWNVKDLPTLARSVARMQWIAQKNRFRLPLLIATDQEGGSVRHVQSGTLENPGNIAIGATDLPQDAFLTGYYIGQELRALGINMNFAPDVDIYTNPEAHIVGARAFGDDPVRVGVLATAYFKGLDLSGVIGTAKHFPGHGSADADSHSSLPVIHSDLETLWDTDLVPYRFLIKEDIPSIMSGHLAFPAITGDETPATISARILKDLAREKMGFKGVIITDDLIMGGIQQLPYDTATITRMALEAGNDLILISRPPDLQEKIYVSLLNHMKGHPDFRKRVREAALRVVELKLRYLKGPDAVPLYPDVEALGDLIPNREGEEFFTDHSFRGITPLRGEFPLINPEETGRILLVGQYKEMFQEGIKVFPQADFHAIPYSRNSYKMIGRDRRLLRQKAEDYDTVVFCLANYSSLSILEGLENYTREVVVLSVHSPSFLKKVPWVKKALALYGTSPASFLAGFNALAGKYKPTGRLPFKAGFLDLSGGPGRDRGRSLNRHGVASLQKWRQRKDQELPRPMGVEKPPPLPRLSPSGKNSPGPAGGGKFHGGMVRPGKLGGTKRSPLWKRGNDPSPPGGGSLRLGGIWNSPTLPPGEPPRRHGRSRGGEKPGGSDRPAQGRDGGLRPYGPNRGRRGNCSIPLGYRNTQGKTLRQPSALPPAEGLRLRRSPL